MDPMTPTERLDRHALVMAIWLAFGLVAAALFDYGLGSGGSWAIIAAFAVVVAAFIGHIIVNAVFRTSFTPKEVVLGLVIYGVGVLAFGMAALFSPGFGARAFLPISVGFVAVFAAVVFYMITHFGVRRAFEAFDVIREFRADGDGADRAAGEGRR
ncbi:hypothetical protein [Rhodoligotrophos defluvii]|uniref:hypothetical protein n=1 Tax=Rhodoligotrophos defluvii TaxID=2561934 RepID=UPI0010CA18E2|nr:hypothetical protein [Rhodoligotrophos defluvii]